MVCSSGVKGCISHPCIVVYPEPPVYGKDGCTHRRHYDGLVLCMPCIPRVGLGCCLVIRSYQVPWFTSIQRVVQGFACVTPPVFTQNKAISLLTDYVFFIMFIYFLHTSCAFHKSVLNYSCVQYWING